MNVVASGNLLKFEHSDSFLPNNARNTPPRSTYEYEYTADQLLGVTVPFTKATTCLKANDTDPMDVFFFVHAAIGLVVAALDSEGEASEIPYGTQQQILAVLEYRYKELFQEKGWLYTPVYLAAAYLNPTRLKSDVFKTEYTLTTKDTLKDI
jgi:hypothetical protein